MFYDFYRNSIGIYIVILSYIIVDFLWSLDFYDLRENPAGNIGGVNCRFPDQFWEIRKFMAKFRNLMDWSNIYIYSNIM